MIKLAVITSHPIQYYSPWFQYLEKYSDFDLRVFYLWDFGVTQKVDRGFQQSLEWDIPLLEGYDYAFVPNHSRNPGTHHFRGLINPTLLTQVQNYAPDAVLMMNYNYASLYRFLWQWNRHKAPVLFRGDSHRLNAPTGIKPWARRQFIAQVYRWFDACLYVGKANYHYFRYHQVPPDHLFFAPHAVDNDRFFAQADQASQQAREWKQTLGISQEQPLILFAGKFEDKKRPLDLLRAFRQANLVDVGLLMVGAGPLESALRVEAEGHANIYFAPFQNQSQMPRTYAAADLVVLPSYGVWETWGLVINEAMGMGRAVLTSTHVGCTEDLVHPYKNGLVFPAGDINALALALREAFADRNRLQQWGQASRRMVNQYSYRQVTTGLERAVDYTTTLAKAA